MKKVNTGNLSEQGEKKCLSPYVDKRRNCAFIPKHDCKYKLWKIHGLMHDYIACDFGLLTLEICDLGELKKGRFHIYEFETGKEVKITQIPWRINK